MGHKNPIHSEVNAAEMNTLSKMEESVDIIDLNSYNHPPPPVSPSYVLNVEFQVVVVVVEA